MKTNFFNIKKMGWKISLIIALILISIWTTTPPSEKIKLGLDLKGGIQMALKVEVDKALQARQSDPDQSREQLKNQCVQRSVETIRNRIDRYGVKDASVQRLDSDGDDKILVTLPGVKDPDRIKELIKSTAMLEFKGVEAGPFVSVEELNAHFGGHLPDGIGIYTTNPKQMKLSYYALSTLSIVAGDDLKRVSTGSNGFGGWDIHFSLHQTAAGKVRDYTAANIGKYLAIVFDHQIESVARIDEVLGQENRLTGNYSFNEANDMVIKLQSGALAAPLTPVKEREVGPSLGADSIQKGFSAIAVGLMLVVVFILMYYGTAGVNAVITLILNLILMMGAIAAMQYTLTLPGIAGILLTIGMAVDANVLVFERIKEELKEGKALYSAISAGFKKAFVSIFDANVTTIIAGLFLLQFGTSTVKGFAVTLIIGICTSMFTSLVVSKIIFQLMYRLKMKKITFQPLLSIGKTFKMNRVLTPRTKQITALLSATIILLGGVLFFTKGFNQGIDFTGGVQMEIEFQRQTDEQVIRGALKDKGIDDPLIQRIGPSGRHFLIKSMIKNAMGSNSDQQVQDDTVETMETLPEKIKQAVAGVGTFKLLDKEVVGPKIGASMKQKVILASIWVIIGMLVYIGARFKWGYGVAAVLTLIHDVLVCLTLLMLFSIPMSLTVVAALLTVIGYSLNDTIVIFDRVRENLKGRKTRYVSKDKKGMDGVFNASISQTLSRTIVTSGTTLMVVLSLLFIGGDVLFAFAFTLMTGILVGTYSSIFQSCVWLGVGKSKWMVEKV